MRMLCLNFGNMKLYLINEKEFVTKMEMIKRIKELEKGEVIVIKEVN